MFVSVHITQKHLTSEPRFEIDWQNLENASSNLRKVLVYGKYDFLVGPIQILAKSFPLNFQGRQSINVVDCSKNENGYLNNNIYDFQKGQ